MANITIFQSGPTTKALKSNANDTSKRYSYTEDKKKKHSVLYMLYNTSRF